jgi:phosphatidylglycerophosphate synthase
LAIRLDAVRAGRIDHPVLRIRCRDGSAVKTPTECSAARLHLCSRSTAAPSYLLAPPPGLELVVLELGRRVVYFRESALVALEGEFSWQNARLPQGDADPAHVVGLSGSGTATLAVPASMQSLEVSPPSGLLARARNVLGWTGELTLGRCRRAKRPHESEVSALSKVKAWCSSMAAEHTEPSGEPPVLPRRELRRRQTKTLWQDAKNLPNLLTFARILMIPAVLVLLSRGTPSDCFWAAIVYSAAAITDALDGWLARRQGLVSVLGKFLDPLADKLIVAAVLVWLVSMGRIPAWAVALLISREISITALRSIASSEGLVIAAGEGARRRPRSR